MCLRSGWFETNITTTETCIERSVVVLVEGCASSYLTFFLEVSPNVNGEMVPRYAFGMIYGQMHAILAHKYPRLASFARNGGISMLEIMQAEDLDTLFMLPLSQEALDELESLRARLQVLPYDQSSQDHWTPIWGNSYTSCRFYAHIFSAMEAHPVFKIIWKSR